MFIWSNLSHCADISTEQEGFPKSSVGAKPEAHSELQFSCRNSFSSRLVNCGGVTECRYWSGKRKWEKMIRRNKLWGSTSQKSFVYIKTPALSSCSLFWGKKRDLDWSPSSGFIWWYQWSYCLLLDVCHAFFPQLHSVWSKKLLHSGSLNGLIDAAKEASPGTCRCLCCLSRLSPWQTSVPDVSGTVAEDTVWNLRQNIQGLDGLPIQWNTPPCATSSPSSEVYLNIFYINEQLPTVMSLRKEQGKGQESREM